MLPPALNIALKEWDTVCRALAAGRQILLLRKGGIYESAGGFEIENRQFLLFPTFLHQNPQMLKDDALQWYEKRAIERVFWEDHLVSLRQDLAIVCRHGLSWTTI